METLAQKGKDSHDMQKSDQEPTLDKEESSFLSILWIGKFNKNLSF